MGDPGRRYRFDGFLSDKHKFLFVHIPKTGGTSIKRALIDYANNNLMKFDGEAVTDTCKRYKPHGILSKDAATLYKDYFKFTFVRNPWARYASIYKWIKKRRANPDSGFTFIEDIISELTFSQYIKSITGGELLKIKHYTAHSQLSFIHKKKKKKIKSYYSKGGEDKVLVDRVFKYENLSEDFETIKDILKLDSDLTLPHYKDTGKYDYREMYNTETIELIKNHCKRDIETFEYQF